MTSHTPGPWTIIDRPDLAFRFGTDYGWEVVCEIGNDKRQVGVAIAPGGAKSAANARLIAAAPTMYAALKQISAGGLGMHGAMTVAESAIAKAEGRDV